MIGRREALLRRIEYEFTGRTFVPAWAEPRPAVRTIGDIIAGKRGITADTDLRLCRFFGLTDGWWLRLQGDYDTRLARMTLARKLAKIKPWSPQ